MGEVGNRRREDDCSDIWKDEKDRNHYIEVFN